MTASQVATSAGLSGEDVDLEVLEMRACLDLLGIHSDSEQGHYRMLLDPDGIVRNPRSTTGIRGAEVLYDALLERLRLYERGNFNVSDLLSGVRYIFALLRRSDLLIEDPARVEILLQNIQSFAASGGPDEEARQKHASVALSAAVLLFNAVSDAGSTVRHNLLRMETLGEILRCATAAERADRVISFMMGQGSEMIERYYASRHNNDEAAGSCEDDLENESEKGKDFANARCGFYRALFHALLSAEARIRFRRDLVGGSDFDSLVIRTGCRALEVIESTRSFEDSDHALAEELVCRALVAPHFTKFGMLLRLDIIRADAHMRAACEALTHVSPNLYRDLLNDESTGSRVVASLRAHREIIETKLRVLQISQACARFGNRADTSPVERTEQLNERADHDHLVPYAALAKAIDCGENDSSIKAEIEKWVILAVQCGLLRAKIDQARKTVRVHYAYDPETEMSRNSWLDVANSLERLRSRAAQIADATEAALLAP
jgi:hypothetical protein